MRKITFLFAALVMFAFSLKAAEPVKTGIYLLFGSTGNWDADVVYDTSNLESKFEFTIDLGDGFYGLELSPKDVGFNAESPVAIQKLFRTFNSTNGQFSQFGSKWISPEKGMRFHYVPELRPENDVIKFVVNSKTLEVNWNASLACGGRFEDYTYEHKELLTYSVESDPEYIKKMNKEEDVLTYRFESLTGAANIDGIFYPRFAYVGQCSNKEFGMTYLLSEQSAEGDGGIKYFDNQFGTPKGTTEKVPMRISFRLNRLESTITYENNEFYIGSDKLVIQGDKYIMFKKYVAGEHSIQVTTPSFEMEVGKATNFSLDKETNVKVWFYADKNPNKDGNLHVEKGVDIPTSIKLFDNNISRVYAANSSVILEGLVEGDNVKIYDVLGEQLLNQVMTNSYMSYNLPTGLYIVTINGASYKIVVR